VRWRNITVSRPSLPEVENNQLSSRGWNKKKALASLPRPRVYSPNAKISKSSVRAGRTTNAKPKIPLAIFALLAS
jgi:hypothetical protein